MWDRRDAVLAQKFSVTASRAFSPGCVVTGARDSAAGHADEILFDQGLQIHHLQGAVDLLLKCRQALPEPVATQRQAIEHVVQPGDCIGGFA
jgi:hypothetical protein